MKNQSLCFRLLASVVLVVAMPSFAQVLSGGLGPSLPSASAGSYYYVAKPGDLTMQINIWGQVRNPGRYEVSTSTDLVQVLSFAGGPTADAKLDEVKVTRFLRQEANIVRTEYFLDMEDLTHVDPGKLVLRPGDTIFLAQSGWTRFRDIATVVTTAAIITSAVAQVVYASKR